MTVKKKTILVIEDSPTQAMLMQLALEGQGFGAICSASAEEALPAIAEVQPDLMVVDYHLPGMQGDEFCRRVRMNINYQGIPILMLTADDTVGAELRGLESGADDYVSKSEDRDVLMLRIHSLLRKSAGQAAFLNGGERVAGKARILAIDDSPTYLAFLLHELSDEGYEVLTAASGVEGIKLAQEGVFDCVMVDFIMPDMDGAEVCRYFNEVRKGAPSPVVILMVSADEKKETVMRALESGADDFVGKSADVAVLRGRIRALLRQKVRYEQNLNLIEEFQRSRDHLERVVEERTSDLKREIGERQRIEEELRKAKERAEMASRAKSEFLANMSHELRTPLNAIIGFSDFIRNEVLGPVGSPQYLDYLNSIHDSGLHLLEIINDILDIARVEGGRVELSEQLQPAAEAVGAAARLIKEQARLGGVTVTTDLGPPGIQLFADQRIVKQACLNLLSNAVKFTPEGGRVHVAVELAPDGGLVVRISDTGIGIAAENLDKVMAPFGQVDSSLARKHTGTGLGLPLANAFAELHGGSLELSSTPGRGTVTELRFPPLRVRQLVH